MTKNIKQSFPVTMTLYDKYIPNMPWHVLVRIAQEISWVASTKNRI